VDGCVALPADTAPFLFVDAQLCGDCGDRLNDKKGKSDNSGDQRSAYKHDIRATVVQKILCNLFAYTVDRVENPIHERPPRSLLQVLGRGSYRLVKLPGRIVGCCELCGTFENLLHPFYILMRPVAHQIPDLFAALEYQLSSSKQFGSRQYFFVQKLLQFLSSAEWCRLPHCIPRITKSSMPFRRKEI
jgi:hypothetical protein